MSGQYYSLWLYARNASETRGILRKGAELNAVQIAELLINREQVNARKKAA